LLRRELGESATTAMNFFRIQGNSGVESQVVGNSMEGSIAEIFHRKD
jgi:hypothetical protein